MPFGAIAGGRRQHDRDADKLIMDGSDHLLNTHSKVRRTAAKAIALAQKVIQELPARDEGCTE